MHGVPIFSPFLGEDHSRPLGLGSDSGLQDRTSNSSTATVITPSCKTFFNTGSSVRAESKQIVSKANNSPNSFFKPEGGIYQFYVCDAQKRWRQSSCSKLKAPQSISGLRAFQNGGHPYVKGSIKEGGFPCENRPERCLPNSPYMEEPSKVFALSVEGLSAGIRMPPFWFGHSS